LFLLYATPGWPPLVDHKSAATTMRVICKP